jgi:hypothetical protein
MTRKEFEDFMKAEQWTPEQMARFSNITPIGTPETIRSELNRPDGMLEIWFGKRSSGG